MDSRVFGIGKRETLPSTSSSLLADTFTPALRHAFAICTTNFQHSPRILSSQQQTSQALVRVQHADILRGLIS
jgi:hypothetical protein